MASTLAPDSAASIPTDLKQSADRPTRRYGYLIGSDTNEKLVLGVHHQQRIDVTGGTDIHDLRASDGVDYNLLHVPKNYFRQRVRYELGSYPLLLNCVTDPDRNPKVLAAIAKMLKGYRGRVINRPEAVQRS